MSFPDDETFPEANSSRFGSRPPHLWQTARPHLSRNKCVCCTLPALKVLKPLSPHSRRSPLPERSVASVTRQVSTYTIYNTYTIIAIDNIYIQYCGRSLEPFVRGGVLGSGRLSPIGRWRLSRARCLHFQEFFIDNLLLRIPFIIVMIRWTGLAP